MSQGGSKPTQSSTSSTTPWGPAQPYLQGAMGKADAWGFGNGYCLRKAAAKAHRARGPLDAQSVAGVAQWEVKSVGLTA